MATERLSMRHRRDPAPEVGPGPHTSGGGPEPRPQHPGRGTRPSHAAGRREHTPCPEASALWSVVTTGTCPSWAGSGRARHRPRPDTRRAGLVDPPPPYPALGDPAADQGLRTAESRARRLTRPETGQRSTSRRTSANLRTVERQLVQEQHPEVPGSHPPPRLVVLRLSLFRKHSVELRTGDCVRPVAEPSRSGVGWGGWVSVPKRRRLLGLFDWSRLASRLEFPS